MRELVAIRKKIVRACQKVQYNLFSYLIGHAVRYLSGARVERQLTDGMSIDDLLAILNRIKIQQKCYMTLDNNTLVIC